MRKKYKVKPSLPNTASIYYGLLDDNCYGCKNKHGCNNCKRAKMYVRKNDIRYKMSAIWKEVQYDSIRADRTTQRNATRC